MNSRIALHVKCAALVISLATLSPRMNCYAGDVNDSLTPSLMSPAPQEDTSVLNRRLQAARKDLEQFLTFAEHFTAASDAKSIEQLKKPVDDFLKMHVDNLLVQSSEQVNLETTRLTAEVLFIKTRLFLNLKQIEPAKATVADMKKRFGPYLKNMVQVAGRSITLNEAIRQLDDELVTAVNTAKKQG
jgi:hypothetical protein